MLLKKHKCDKIEKITVTGRSYLKFDELSYTTAIDNHDWTVFDDSFCVIECWNELMKPIVHALDRMCPAKNF